MSNQAAGAILGAYAGYTGGAPFQGGSSAVPAGALAMNPWGAAIGTGAQALSQAAAGPNSAEGRAGAYGSGLDASNFIVNMGGSQDARATRTSSETWDTGDRKGGGQAEQASGLPGLAGLPSWAPIALAAGIVGLALVMRLRRKG